VNQPDLKTEIAFTELCDEAQIVYSGSTAVFVGLSRAGRLHASTLSGHHLLSTNVTSFTCASGFIIYTTTTHEAFFAPLITVAAGWESTAPTWETRRIERGARIVCAVPSTTALVLQMPRGNLETIAPRPIVMAVIQRDIDA
jgi:elongator complex protein 1